MEDAVKECKTRCHQQCEDIRGIHPSKNERRSKMLKLPESECLDIWMRLPRHKWPKSWSNIEDAVVHLERNLYGHPPASLSCERQFEKVLLGLGWEQEPN